MVRTRQNREVETDSPPRFLALEGKGSRKSRYQTPDGEDDSDHSGIVYKDEDEHNIFEDKVVESRLRPRVGPTRAYNYVYEDSSDDDLLSSRRRRSRVVNEDVFSSHRRHRHQSCQHSSDDEVEEGRKIWRSSRRLQTHGRIKTNQEDEVDGTHASEDDDGEDDFNNSALVRRSKRLREKPIRYRTKPDKQTAHEQGHGDSGADVDRGKRRRSDSATHDSNNEFDDMYSRVKRPRHKKNGTDSQEHSASNSDASNDEADKNDSENETEQRRSYSLREQRRMPQRYVAPIEETRKKPKPQSLFRETPPRRVNSHTYRSPAHRSSRGVRKRHALNGSSSSTSSDTDSGGETTDEQRFSRRKAKSMVKARSRIMPLNFTKDAVSASSILKDRVRAGASLADVDPMDIDRSVTFDSVGGLQKHIRTLKEMIVFPLLYPEFYERFKVAPSRGVLFYGPPGTGKTLVARALANECSRGEQRVAFFMRKGADCLSKWVGEAERQLRLLFDKAYEMRPSIIFFDEIDGLAPVRSSRQDQIHSSIVSTLLALMDGIDSRGEIVVIGATNRVDAIDPALRRPGRFDREFHFPLPNIQDRKKILKIHTKHWDPSLHPDFISELAEKCAGYCGADIKCLVTEATQNALRRHYPQIYTSSDKLQLDVASITLTARDFAHALSTIIPAAQRAAPSPASALEASVQPLLQHSLTKLQSKLASKFPFAKLENRPRFSGSEQGGSKDESTGEKQVASADLELVSDEDEDVPSIFLTSGKGHRPVNMQPPIPASFLGSSSSSSSFPTLFRPRLLVSGAAGQGQTVHLAPAALNLVEHLPVHTLSCSTLFAASAKMPEEACATVFHEAKRTAPSVIYMPYVNELWSVASDSLRVTFLSLLRSMNPSTPILMFATSEMPYRELDNQLRELFSAAGGEVMETEVPTVEERRQYFADLILNQVVRPPPTRKQAECKLASEGIVRLFPERKPSLKQTCGDHLSNCACFEVCAATTSKPAEPSCGHSSPEDNRHSKNWTCSHGSGSAAADSFSKHTNICSKAPEQRLNVSFQGLNVYSGWHSTVSEDPVPSTSASTQQPRAFGYAHRSRPVSHNRFRLPPQKKVKTDPFAGITFSLKNPRAKGVCTTNIRHGVNRGLNWQRSKKTSGSLNFNQSACYSALQLPQIVKIHERRYPSRKAAFTKLFPREWFDCGLDRTVNDKRALNQDMTLPAMRILQSLPKAPPPEPRKLTEKEQKKLAEQEEDTVRELRIFLRDILSKLGREKKFSIFTKPVDIDEVPDYYEIIKKPMDLSTIMAKIDLHQYTTACAFMDDIFLICSNALEYNPDKGPTDRAIRHRACALRDTAQALLKTELDPEFERICQEITQSRKRRGVDSSRLAPAFYHTRPLASSSGPAPTPSAPSTSARDETSSNTLTHPEASRFSRRVRGISAEKTISLEVVEKSAQLEKSLLANKKCEGEDLMSAGDNVETTVVGANRSTEKDSGGDASGPGNCDAVDASQLSSECNCNNSAKSPTVKSSHSGKPKAPCDSRHMSASTLKKMNQRKKCPWLTTKRRKRFNSAQGQKPKGQSPSSDVEMLSGDDTPDPGPTKRSSRRESQQSDHELSPQTAANPENVQLASMSKTPVHCVTRRSSSGETGNGTQGSSHELSPVLPASLINSPSAEQDQNKAPPATTSPAAVCNNVMRSEITRRRLEDELLAATTATDSGLGSSVESNGDSRDSLEHNNSNSNPVIDQESHDSGTEIEGASSGSKGFASTSVIPRTRARTQDPVQQRALMELEEMTPVIQVDKEKLRHLLDHIVQRTDGFTVERLQKLYSMLSCAVYNSRLDYNKSHLVQEMEQLVERFCKETQTL